MSTAQQVEAPWDCIIIGGGPAGLTCAIFLGRYRRRVLVIDSGTPRNAASHGVHGFLGQHGIVPGDLLRRGRDEAESVGVRFVDAVATAACRNGDVFEVTTADEVFRGRRVVLAYGVRDKTPDIPDFDKYYGWSIFHCPDCDGYEVSDKRVGVIGWGKKVAGFTLNMLQWTEELTVLTNGNEHELSQEEMSKLQAQEIRIVREKIAALEGADGALKAVVLDGGLRIELDAMFFTIGVERTCNLAEMLGCDVYDDLPNVKVDEHKQTSVEGVYAVGDLVPGSQLVVTSAADGAVAAIALNKTLVAPNKKV